MYEKIATVTAQKVWARSDFSLNYSVRKLLLGDDWWLGMVINASVQYNGGVPPDIILLTQGYLHRGTRLNNMKKLCICSL